MAKTIHTGYKYIFSRRLDSLFAIAIGTAAATIRIRREETCHRLGLPSDSMVSIIEQERHKFDDTPTFRSRLAESSWSIGNTKEANYLRQDAMRNKPKFKKTEDQEPSSTAIAPLLSKDPETGEFVLNPSRPAKSGEDFEEFNDEEIRRRDEEAKRKFKEAQPGVDELLVIFGSRAIWYTTTSWTEYWEQPWFWHNWGEGWGNWQTSSKGPSDKDYK